MGGPPGEDFEEKGRDVAEGLEAARLLESYGYDALDTDVGTYDACGGTTRPCIRRRDCTGNTAKW